jgi:23S rRNA (pseudouridine1915-N3)-methyltransferase
MQIRLIQVGKTEDSYLQEGIGKYSRKLQFYTSFEIITLPNIKSVSNSKQEINLRKEAENILKTIHPKDYSILLDEKGKEFSSIEFSEFISEFQPLGSLSGFTVLNFIIGGPFGFDKTLYEKTKLKLSLSQMTFSHQMIRLLFTEQLYRAFSILKKEPYHHL